MGVRAVGPIIGGVNAEKIELAGWVAGAAHGKQQTTPVGKISGGPININFQDAHEPAPRLTIKVGLGVAEEIAEHGRTRAGHRRTAAEELIGGRGPDQSAPGLLVVNGQGVVHNFQNEAIACRHTLIGRLQGELAVA